MPAALASGSAALARPSLRSSGRASSWGSCGRDIERHSMYVSPPAHDALAGGTTGRVRSSTEDDPAWLGPTVWALVWVAQTSSRLMAYRVTLIRSTSVVVPRTRGWSGLSGPCPRHDSHR